MTEARCARILRHGDPAEVLAIHRLELGPPGPGQVLVRMRRAPVNPADINVIEGTYGRLPVLPATVGNEGLGEVVAFGSGVSGLAVGDLVRPLDGIGTWATVLVADAARCLRLPAGLPDDQAAMLTINPATAWCVLHEFVQLAPGDAVLLNAPTSAVGTAVLAIAQRIGCRVGCLVRRAEDGGALRSAGAAAVAVEGREAARELKAALGPARLALNMVGGDSATTLAKALGPMGWLVTVGAMGRQPLALPNGPVIFNELRCAGFWVSRWYERADPARIARMLDDCAGLVRCGGLRIPVAATYPLERAVEAVARARTAGRGGKVMLDLA